MGVKTGYVWGLFSEVNAPHSEEVLEAVWEFKPTLETISKLLYGEPLDKLNENQCTLLNEIKYNSPIWDMNECPQVRYNLKTIRLGERLAT